MTIRLDPPQLGQVRVAIAIQGTTVSASLLAGTNEARALLEGSLDQLRNALAEHGLTVERLSVDRLAPDRLAMERLNRETPIERPVAHPTSTNRQEQGQSTGERATDGASQQQHDAADGRSRGRRDPESAPGERRRDRGSDSRAFSTTFTTARDRVERSHS